ncbi:MAG: hypothetical protein R6X25_03090 [Candidatus Krumholzibacteriia bacterium]
MNGSSHQEYRLRVGDAVIALRGLGDEFAASLATYFQRPSEIAAAHVQLTLEVHAVPPRDEIPSSLYATKQRHPDGGFTAADGLLRGSYDPGSGEGRLRIEDPLLEGRCVRVFEQILYQAYHSAVARGAPGGTLVHASGVARQGAGYLFVGASGRGKSTIAGLCADHLVLNDEIVLVQPDGDGRLVLRDTPFNGYFRTKQPGEAPLRAVFLLEHGPEHRVVLLPGAEAVAALTTQVVPPIGLEAFLTNQITVSMFHAAREIADSVPVRSLEFRRDDGFWSAIDAHLAADGAA